jgi:predicted membrane chloride channel (bestrophin family)
VPPNTVVAARQDVAGACERLLRTPIPLSYTRHTSRFLMIWLTLLPFTLWTACRWATLPLALVVSFLLLGELAALLGMTKNH